MGCMTYGEKHTRTTHSHNTHIHANAHTSTHVERTHAPLFSATRVSHEGTCSGRRAHVPRVLRVATRLAADVVRCAQAMQQTSKRAPRYDPRHCARDAHGLRHGRAAGEQVHPERISTRREARRRARRRAATRHVFRATWKGFTLKPSESPPPLSEGVDAIGRTVGHRAGTSTWSRRSPADAARHPPRTTR